ncbi:hypothetical protein E4Z66_04750 [Aliishimia ponticola]|uniref:PRC-barrel domain containing protein n=1 Tax=Aliishimia ponticola TaxID=2499833 RepID=A0A4S4NGU2_9RHOB|nr:hypothetical protein [Aliishimia ponticola]THH38872.1 hypothetical protein E4Z66_04750 [Aliishimia ponticola]
MKRILTLTTAAAALVATTAFADAPFKGSDNKAYPTLETEQAANHAAKGVRYNKDTMSDISYGSGIYTTEGTVIGSIESWERDGAGSEMTVALNEEAGIPADTLVLSIAPEAVMKSDNVVMLDTTLAELKLKAEANTIGEKKERIEIDIN